VHQLFYENTAESDYASLFFAAYDDHTRRLCYANCGHPPAFILRRDGAVERLTSTSTVMGLFEEWDCAMAERQLFPDDTLVLYTDGATEALDQAGEEYGEARLEATVRQHRELSADELVAAIARQVRQFSPLDQADDITLLVAKCL
jgi:serine phosphatase RsbU (regulator of sigma subunit)